MNPNEILNESGQDTPRIEYFPVSFFSVIMGLSGFTLAWKGADNLFFHNSAIWLCLAYVTSIREGANKRGNSSRLTQSFHFFMFEPIFSPVNALNQPI